MSHPLRDSRAKLERANAHIDALRTEVMEATEGSPKSIPLSREFDPEAEAVVWRIKHVPQISQSWGLLIGDAIHNLRGALDHAWWQLAIRKLGREPSEKEAKAVQFPILSDPRYVDRAKWNAHLFLSHVNRSDAAKIKPLQPFNKPRDQNKWHPLAVLADLSNVDKHRSVNVVLYVADRVTFTPPGAEHTIDCDLISDRGRAQVHILIPRAAPGTGDVVLEIYVRPTGPNPDVELNASLTGFVAIYEAQDAIATLGHVEEWVSAALDVLEPVF